MHHKNFWYFAIKNNNKMYYITHIRDKNNAIVWSPNTKNALKFDKLVYAIEFKNEFIPNRPDILVTNSIS